MILMRLARSNPALLDQPTPRIAPRAELLNCNCGFGSSRVDKRKLGSCRIQGCCIESPPRSISGCLPASPDCVINGIITSSLRVLFRFVQLGSKGIGILARAVTTLMRDVISVSGTTLCKRIPTCSSQGQKGRTLESLMGESALLGGREAGRSCGERLNEGHRIDWIILGRRPVLTNALLSS